MPLRILLSLYHLEIELGTNPIDGRGLGPRNQFICDAHRTDITPSRVGCIARVDMDKNSRCVIYLYDERPLSVLTVRRSWGLNVLRL
jgi:hypothetical protein